MYIGSLPDLPTWVMESIMGTSHCSRLARIMKHSSHASKSQSGQYHDAIPEASTDTRHRSHVLWAARGSSLHVTHEGT
jgi:hypothetical protein